MGDKEEKHEVWFSTNSALQEILGKTSSFTNSWADVTMELQVCVHEDTDLLIYLTISLE